MKHYIQIIETDWKEPFPWSESVECRNEALKYGKPIIYASTGGDANYIIISTQPLTPAMVDVIIEEWDDSEGDWVAYPREPLVMPEPPTRKDILRREIQQALQDFQTDELLTNQQLVVVASEALGIPTEITEHLFNSKS